MKILLFGATGMVGQSVLIECLRDQDVEKVVAIGRNSTGVQHEKFSELIVPDVKDLSAHEAELFQFDACFFCLGISSVGMGEEKYTAITYDITMAVAELLARLNNNMTFTYVTGQSTDSTEKGKVMWARVKGKTENDLLKLPFKAVYLFRPGAIIPMNGVRSKTKLYQFFYTIMRPFNPLIKRVFSKSIVDSEMIGRSMIEVVRNGYEKPVLENADIIALGNNASNHSQ